MCVCVRASEYAYGKRSSPSSPDIVFIYTTIYGLITECVYYNVQVYTYLLNITHVHRYGELRPAIYLLSEPIRIDTHTPKHTHPMNHEPNTFFLIE